MLNKTLESPLDCKKIQPVHPKGGPRGPRQGASGALLHTACLELPGALQGDSSGQRPWLRLPGKTSQARALLLFFFFAWPHCAAGKTFPIRDGTHAPWCEVLTTGCAVLSRFSHARPSATPWTVARQGRQGSRGCIPGSPGESGLVSSKVSSFFTFSG